MSRRKERLIFRTPSPGIGTMDEPTSPPPPPRPERFIQRRLLSLGTDFIQLNERLASVLSTDSSTDASRTEIDTNRRSPEPISPLHDQSTSPSRRSYSSYLYHRRTSRTSQPLSSDTYQSLSSWDSSPLFDFLTTTVSSPPPTSSPQQSTYTSLSPQPNTSTTTCRQSSMSKLDRHKQPLARQNKLSLDKIKRKSGDRTTHTPRHKSLSPHRSSGPKFLRVKSTTSVGSDTSEEELDHDVKVRRLWANRLRPRKKTNKDQHTNIDNSIKGKARIIESNNTGSGTNVKKSPVKSSLSKKRRTTTATKYVSTSRFRSSASSHEPSEILGSIEPISSPSKKETKTYPVRHSSRRIKPRIRSL